MIPVLILIISTILVSLAFGRYLQIKHYKLPPGNIFCWPLIGETLSFFALHPTTARGGFLEDRIPKFGTIFLSHLMGRQTIVSADPELNRLILKKDDIDFETNYPHNFVELMSKFALVVTHGDTHKHLRSVIRNFLSTERFNTVFLRDAEQLVSELLTSWEDCPVISLKEEVHKFSFYYTVKQMLSMEHGEPETEKMRREYQAFAEGMISPPIYLPGTNWWKAFKSRAYLLNFLKEKTEEKMGMERNGERTGREDFLTYLVKNANSMEEICGLLLNLLFAGHHTTSQAMASMLHFITGCPKAIEQLREENLQITKRKKLKGESALTWDDYRGMEFTQCVIKEALRLGNIVPFIFRKSTTNFSFKEYVMPRGCPIIVHTSGIHLDPALYEDPQLFNPWRWLNSGSSKSNAFMPFGGGGRLCVGNMLARLQLMVFLHHFIMKYDWEFVEHGNPTSSPTIDFTNGLKIKVQIFHIDPKNM